MPKYQIGDIIKIIGKPDPKSQLWSWCPKQLKTVGLYGIVNRKQTKLDTGISISVIDEMEGHFATCFTYPEFTLKKVGHIHDLIKFLPNYEQEFKELNNLEEIII